MNTENLPLISIITPCLNRMDFIAEALDSALDQDYPNFEHIIMDGGSTDGTLEVLARYPHLKIISERDKGMYDALNKGIRIAHGQIIGFLNTDDFYASKSFRAVADTFLQFPDILAVAGTARIFRTNSQNEKEWLYYYKATTPDQALKKMTLGIPCFNAWFFRIELFQEIGQFDVSLLYAADREFLIRCALNKISFQSINQVLYNYRQHPGSFTITGNIEHDSKVHIENRIIAEKFRADPGISEEERRIFFTWLSYIFAEQVLAGIRTYNPRIAWRYALAGWRSNPQWPVVFIKIILEGIWLRIKGKGPDTASHSQE